MTVWSRSRSDVLVVGEQLGRVGAEHRGAAGLQPDHEPPARMCGARVSTVGGALLAGGQLAGGDPGQAAADRLGGQLDPPAGRLEHLDRGLADVRMEVVGERVRPEQHGAAVAVAAGAAAI